MYFQDMRAKKTVKYGTLTLNLINSGDSLVPTAADPVTLASDDKKSLAIAIRENLPCLLIGETGTGKSSAVREIAYLLRQPYVRVNMTGFTTPDELIGSKSVKDGATYYENGIITDAMERGAILVLDEINATSPDCLFILHGLLDEDRRITLPNGAIVTPHPDFRVFATCNPDYEGTKAMNKAFLDRFPITIFVDTLAPKPEQDLLVQKIGLASDLAMKMVSVATMARKDYTEQKISTYISTRSLLSIGKLIQSGLAPRLAYSRAVIEKISSKEEKKILLDFFLSVFKLAEGSDTKNQPIVITQGELDDLKKQVEHYGDEYRAIGDKVRKIEDEKYELEKQADQGKQYARDLTEANEKMIEMQKQIDSYKKLEDIIKAASQKITF